MRGRDCVNRAFFISPNRGIFSCKEKVENMQISNKGLEWLKSKENKVLDKNGRHVIYDDATGKPVAAGAPLPKGATIGYGHLIKPGEDFSKGLSDEEAKELYRHDIAIAEDIVKNNIDVPLSQQQFDGLVSLAYNIGAGNFSSSTIVKYINNPDYNSKTYSTPEKAWKAWNKTNHKISQGLINRRNSEWNIFENGVYE